MRTLIENSNQKFSLLEEKRESFAEWYTGFRTKIDTGFEPLEPIYFQNAFLNLKEKPTSFAVDLFCGNGGFALMAAAYGMDSYGIDVNEELIQEAKNLRDLARKRGLISDEIVCEFIVGNVYTSDFKKKYELAREKRRCEEGCHCSVK